MPRYHTRIIIIVLIVTGAITAWYLVWGQYYVWTSNGLQRQDDKAITFHDPTVCSRIIKGMFSYFWGTTQEELREDCYSAYIDMYPDADICPAKNNECQAYYALVNDRPDICLSLNGDLVSNKQTIIAACIASIAIKYNRPSLCQILQTSLRQQCTMHTNLAR